MFKVTINIFSGRANPTWLVHGDEAEAVLRRIASTPGMISPVPAEPRLGYRSTEISLLSDEAAGRYGLPQRFRIAAPGAADLSGGIEMAQRLILGPPGRLAAGADGGMPQFLADQVAQVAAPPPHHVSSADAGSAGLAPGAGEAPAKGCIVESTTFNPNFWNNPQHQLQNNCYAYACNQATNTWPQHPGRASGHEYTAYTPQNVSAAAKSDGAHDVDVCFPDSEKPRWLVALVIWPGKDFHWYRHSSEGFWGHKMGQCPVVNIDHGKQVISSPRLCDRGPYAQFYGYMIIPKSQKVA